MKLFIARLSVALLSFLFQLATSTSFYPLKIGQDFQAGYSDDDILRGFKLNGDDENPLKEKVFEGDIIIIPFTSTYDRAKLIQDHNDVEDSMAISGSLSVTYKMMIKGKAEASYFQNTASSKNAATITYRLRRVAYAKKVKTSSLKETEELKALTNTNSLDEIADKYGTKFIDQMLYGAQLDIDFKLSSVNEEDIQRISAKLQGEINLKAIQIEFDAEFGLNKTETNSNLQSEITASSSGLSDFSIPANPTFEEVVTAIDDFQEKYAKLVENAKNRTNVDNMTNVLEMFSPVGFSVSSIADYQPKLNKFEAATLENRMEDVADVFYSTLYLKEQLKATKDRQETIYTQPRDKVLWFNPYANQVDRVIELLDGKIDECLNFQRLPMAEIIGRKGNATVPKPNAIEWDIKDGLLGFTFLPSDVTILNTEFKNKFYTGFGLKVNDENEFCESCPMKPWLSGSLREVNNDDGSYNTIATGNTPGKLVYSSKESIELEESEVRIYTKVNKKEQQFILNQWTNDLESFKITDSGPRALSFEYKAYVEDVGRQDWVSSGFVGNPTNASKFLEAFAIRIDGNTQHSVSYAAQIDHPDEGIVTTRKFRDGELCFIRHGKNQGEKLPIKAIFVSIETKQQYAPCDRSSLCICEDTICHDATATTSHVPSMVPSLTPTASPSMVPSKSPTKSKETRPPSLPPTPEPTPYPTPNPTPEPTPYPTPNPTRPPTRPPTKSIWIELHRYYRAPNHFYTTNFSELGNGRSGYRKETSPGNIATTQVSGTVPLYRYYGHGNHFYTTSKSEIGTVVPGQVGKHGYKSEGIAGYCFPSQKSGYIPLYRYRGNGDHFYTTNRSEIGTTTPGQWGKYGYKSEGIACYIQPR